MGCCWVSGLLSTFFDSSIASNRNFLPKRLPSRRVISARSKLAITALTALSVFAPVPSPLSLVLFVRTDSIGVAGERMGCVVEAVAVKKPEKDIVLGRPPSTAKVLE
jgi:hypothetical protein